MSPTKLITSLTEAQIARFPEFVEKWTAIGLSTKPADRERAEAAIEGIYKLAGLKRPRVIWLPCPLSAALATTAYAIIVGHKVAEEVRLKLTGKTKSAVGSAVRSAVDSAVRSAVGSAVDSAVDSAVRSAVLETAHSLGRNHWGGSLWPGYAAWADYFNEVFKISIDRNYLDLIESCGYFWTLNGICFASERPAQINLDDSGRLHSDNSKSIGYPSGWGLWHWHGVGVPGQVIEHPELITVEQILAETNAEVRRVLIERYGLTRYLVDSRAKKIAEDEFGELYWAEIPGDEPLVMVKVLNSTPEEDGSLKPYFLRVNPELRPLLGGQEMGGPQAHTPLNAVASTFGLTGKEYLQSLVAQS